MGWGGALQPGLQSGSLSPGAKGLENIAIEGAFEVPTLLGVVL